MQQPAARGAGAAVALRHYTRRPRIPPKRRQPAVAMSNEPSTPPMPAPILSPELNALPPAPRAAITPRCASGAVPLKDAVRVEEGMESVSVMAIDQRVGRMRR